MSNELCRFSELNPETPEHLLTVCSLNSVAGKDLLKVNYIRSSTPGKMMNFLSVYEIVRKLKAQQEVQ